MKSNFIYYSCIWNILILCFKSAYGSNNCAFPRNMISVALVYNNLSNLQIRINYNLYTIYFSKNLFPSHSGKIFHLGEVRESNICLEPDSYFFKLDYDEELKYLEGIQICDKFISNPGEYILFSLSNLGKCDVVSSFNDLTNAKLFVNQLQDNTYSSVTPTMNSFELEIPVESGDMALKLDIREYKPPVRKFSRRDEDISAINSNHLSSFGFLYRQNLNDDIPYSSYSGPNTLLSVSFLGLPQSFQIFRPVVSSLYSLEPTTVPTSKISTTTRSNQPHYSTVYHTPSNSLTRAPTQRYFSSQLSFRSTLLSLSFDFISTYPTDQPSTTSETPSQIPSPRQYSISFLPTSAECPSSGPTLIPSLAPSYEPIVDSTLAPDKQPTSRPTADPYSQPSSQPNGQPSIEPSFQPLTKPSSRPSALPSSQPMTKPSTVPFENPSEMPSLQPQGTPSRIPLSCPTHSPSAHPLGTPSSRPSDLPSYQPHEMPLIQVPPLSLPSHVPTPRPAEIPTGSPYRFVQPTSQPSRQLTVQPSESYSITYIPSNPDLDSSSEPSDLPSLSCYPTPLPSDTPSPSLKPTIQPFIFDTSKSPVKPTTCPSTTKVYATPSRVPSKTPSCVSSPPSRFPSTLPTDFPTTFPIISDTPSTIGYPTSAPTIDVFNDLTLYSAQFVKTLPDYSYIHYEIKGCRGESAIRDTSWPLFVNSLEIADVENFPTSILLFYSKISCFEFSKSFEIANYTCSVASSVKNIWSSFLGLVDNSIYCNNNIWVIKKCSNFVNICVNCENPCFNVDKSGTVLPLLKPDGSLSVLESNALLSGLAFKVASKPRVWINWEQNCSIDKSIINVKYKVSDPCVLTCGISNSLPIYDSVYKSNLFVYKDLRISNYFELNGALTLEIPSSLRSITQFEVLCYTDLSTRSSFLVYKSPALVSLNKACNVSYTVPAKRQARITIITSFSSLAVGELSPPIVLSLSETPTGNTFVYPVVYYSNTSVCEVNWNSSTATVVNALDSPIAASVAPSKLSFTLVTENVFYVQPILEGCYYISANITSFDDTLNFSVSKGTMFYAFYNSRTSLAVSGVAFVNNGLKLQLTFSANTDKGVTQGLDAEQWSCAKLLIFQSASSSMCLFASASSIYILLSPSTPNDHLPTIGSEVKVMGGIVKKSCIDDSSAPSICDHFPFLDSVSVNISSLGAISPRAVILGPSSMSVNSSLVLDLSLLKGSGGRNWMVFKWAVEGPSTYISANLTALMNGGLLRWIDCTPGSFDCNRLHQSYFNQVGLYKFTLTVVNFWGLTDQNSFVVEVIDSFIPQVTVLRASYTRIYPNVSFELETKFSYSQISYEAEVRSVKYFWSVFTNNIFDLKLTSSLTEANNHGSKLFVSSYSLTSLNEYRFCVQAVFFR